MILTVSSSTVEETRFSINTVHSGFSHMANREDVINAAIRVASKEGIGKCTAYNLAQEARCSVDEVRKYFGSRDDLMCACYRQVYEEFMGIICLPEHEWSKQKTIGAVECIWRI